MSVAALTTAMAVACRDRSPMATRQLEQPSFDFELAR